MSMITDEQIKGLWHANAGCEYPLDYQMKAIRAVADAAIAADRSFRDDPTCAAEKLRPTDIEYTRSDLIPKASVITDAITKSWELGQKYWQLSDSENPKDWKKATGVRLEMETLRNDLSLLFKD